MFQNQARRIGYNFIEGQIKSMASNPSVVLLLAAIAVFSTPLLVAADRIAGPIDNNHRVRFRGQVHAIAQTEKDLGPVPDTMDLSYVTLYLKPSSALDLFLTEQQNPSSQNFHRWLTPEEFADRFGLSGNDIAKISAWLQSQGLSINDVARGRHWITISGSARQFARAFQTDLRRYKVKDKTYYANAAELSVPAALESVVAGFEGLSDLGPKPFYHEQAQSTGPDRPQYNSSGRNYLAPEDFATIYNVKELYNAGIDGTGMKIAVIGRTEIDIADIRAFRTRFNLPANDPQLVLFGPTPGISPGDVPEADLDVEWSGAVAPKATILYVYSRSVNTSVQYAVDQNLAPVITFSYGNCERTVSPAIRYIAQQANAQGITWLAASGDAGAATCDDFTATTPQASKGQTLSLPASVPEVTAVGGTEFDEGTGNYWSLANSAGLGSALSYIPEKVWNNSLARNSFFSSGGGLSAIYPRPAWQTGPGVPTGTARAVPDISFSASADHVGYGVITGGRLGFFGGTSVSSPAFAGAVALLNQYLVSKGTITQPGLGNINPTLYRLAQSTTGIFHDVINGHNKVACVQGSPDCVNGLMGYDAGPGYDMATGLGSADIFNLVTKWTAGPASTTKLTASAAKIASGETIQLTATVTGDGSAIPSGIVTFLAGSSLIGSAALQAAGTATIGATWAQIASANGTVRVAYEGDGVYNGSGGSATIQLALPSSGSAVIPSINTNPVTQVGTVWPYTLTLREIAGVATKLTSWTVNGTAQLVSSFGTGDIPANGSVSVALTGNVIPPLDRTFIYNGTDADGRTWTQQMTIPFVGPLGPGLTPAMTLTSAPGTIQQNFLADPTCLWTQKLTIQEQSGFQVSLTGLTAGTTSFTTRIQQIFGTTRLAPFGTLQGIVCFSGTDVTAPASRAYSLTGVAESGAIIIASLPVTFSPPFASPAAFSATRGETTITPASGTTTVSLKFNSGTPQWSATLTPDNRTSKWLTVTPISGSGPADLTVTAASAGLSPGVYYANLVIQAANASPQFISMPFTFIVGSSPGISIGGVANNFSGKVAIAPGMLASVYGTGLSASTQNASRIPLPLTIAGVSVTVNGVAAPLLHVLPGQLDIQIPYEVGSGPAMLGVNNNGKVASFPIEIVSSAPGLWPAFVSAAGAIVTAAKRGDTLVTYMTGEGDLTVYTPSGSVPVTGTPLARLPRPRLPVAMTIGGVPADVAFSGIVQFTGVSQINFTVPASAPTGVQPLIVTVGGVASTPVNLTVNP